jgi:glycosyltransferase involved in cell wall biosynthesis
LTATQHSAGGLQLYPLELHRFEGPLLGNQGGDNLSAGRVAELALREWNAYLRTDSDVHKGNFLAHISWLWNSEVRKSHNLGVWPTQGPSHGASQCVKHLSAGVQATIGSALLRAHALVGDDKYRAGARRALGALEIEILDGGVGSMVGSDGYFLEDVAVYPAAHNLSGCLLGLLALHDYFMLYKDRIVGDVIERSTRTLHSLLGLYDVGYWTRMDLLGKRLASTDEHSLHATAVRALATYSGCDHCAKLADHWAGYQRRQCCNARRMLAGVASYSHRTLLRRAVRSLLPADGTTSPTHRARVCIALPAFPVAGGTRAIVTAMSEVMANDWDITYLTNRVGDNPTDLKIERFGGRLSTPWQFPGVWFHAVAGSRKLNRLIRRGNRFSLMLPQDGSYTAFFASIVGKMYGARVVSVEHGTVMFPYSPVYRAERLADLRKLSAITRIGAQLRLALYWPSLHFMARVAARFTDQFLVAGDEIEETYRERLGVHPSRIVRFNPSIDTKLFRRLDLREREVERGRIGLASDDLVILMNGRLAPAKGLDIALAAIAEVRRDLPRELQNRLRLLVAGDGPLRAEVEATMRTNGLLTIGRMLGEATPGQAALLLGVSDIFLYTSLRGTNTSLAVLEAMAAGCAVVASEEPRSHANLLAAGRGISTLPGDVTAVTAALLHLIQDSGAREDMGNLARDYVIRQYGELSLKRALLRATFYSPNSTPRLPP